MRILLTAFILFLIIHAIRVDFSEGTIPQKPALAFEKECTAETSFIVVTSVEGDTIESLFALYPDHEMTFMDRLEQFYSLNPHLKLQQIVSGDSIALPLSTSQEDCK